MQYISKTIEYLFLLIVLYDGIRMVLCQCSGTELTLTTSKDFQYVTSPGYNGGSGTYQSNLDCSWIIDSGAADAKVLLYVENYDVTCSGDVINIYDGSSTGSTKLQSDLCGSGSSSVYSSTQRYVRISFVSDGSSQGVGFNLAYLGTADLSGPGCSGSTTLTPTDTPQYITSPAFPDLYSVNANCRWVVTATSGTVKVEIIFTDIETSTNCAFDSLEIYDGGYLCDEIKSAAICTPHANSASSSIYNSNGSSILMRFKSDGSLSYHGFILKYSLIASSSSSSSSDSTVTASGDFTLGLAIGFGSGAGAAFILVATIVFLKNLCKGQKRIGSPRVQNVHSLSVTSSSSRTNSISGSSISGDSGSRNTGYHCSTPITPSSSVVIHLQKLHQKRNAFIK